MTTPVAKHATAPVNRRHSNEQQQGALHARLLKVIEHAAHLLPAQGPITVFIHHNTLHAFEDLPFTEAVKEAATIFDCQPFLAKDRYRQELGRGRIRSADLLAMLREDLGARADEAILRTCTRLELRLAMLQYPLRYGPTEELLWFIAETDALRRFRDDIPVLHGRRMIAETRRWVMRELRGKGEAGTSSDDCARRASRQPAANLAGLIESLGENRIDKWSEGDWEAFTLQALWRVCGGVAETPEPAPATPPPVRSRDLLVQATGRDPDLLVNDLLIRYCGAFLDQGLASWQLPWRDEGFFRAFIRLYRMPGGMPERWLAGLPRELTRLEDKGIGPLESIRESLELLGVPESEWDEYLSATLLVLRGWAGMIHFLEERPDRAVHPVPPGSLVEFLAIRLLLDRLALADVASSELGFARPLSELRAELLQRVVPSRPPSVQQRAFLVFQLAQLLGWTPEELSQLSEREWAALLDEMDSFPTIERRRIFHLAYERFFYSQTLDALALHGRESRNDPASPRFQAMFCIDDREESLRRHIEELAPDAATFGIAGFYFIDMYFRGVADAHFAPLCPVVVRPQHWVVEQVDASRAGDHQRWALARRTLGLASHQIHVGSRTFVLGAMLSAIGGVLATAPLVARTLFPRLTARLRKRFGRAVLPPPPTRLVLEGAAPDSAAGNGRNAYTLPEMTAIAERVLRDTGLTSGFARLVLTFGHGSTSLNNPHESAYQCGACGGVRGGPSGRAIAQILNDPRVRSQLLERGLGIPRDTIFVGGMHNTGNEEVTFFDLDLVPESHRQELDVVRAVIERACDRNAHERCRRFESAPLTLSFASARQHVEGRSEDLSQARPELGHATNGVTIVGRRRRTRGLFLDRRAFLNSYDPTQDDAKGTILERILQAAIPVCAGIGLEYYFSCVDNGGYGCGSKLPHNVASLLGVMDGAASDLRTGLPWQMVEIHEPVRQLFVIEARPDLLCQVLARNSALERLVRNDWVRLAILDPDSPKIQMFRSGAFEEYQPQAEHLPRARSSVDWYLGRRDHLEFAQIGDA